MTCEYCGTVFCVDVEEDGWWLSGEVMLYCDRQCRARGYWKKKQRARRQRERSGEGACKAPYKRRFATLAAAERGVIESGIALRPYQCQCGDWHLTSALQATSP
jgi:hypothetical protein